MTDIDKEIEEELDDYDFHEPGVMVTREGMRAILLKQKSCTHKFYPFGQQQGDRTIGIRCHKCGYQVFS